MESNITQLWTIQTLEAWADLQKTGILEGHWSRADRDFVSAYKWLMRQMRKRRIKINKDTPPIWAWESAHKPDLRCVALLPRGTRGVRLRLEVPSNLVLFSEFHAWHWVLNNDCFPDDNEADWERWSDSKLGAYSKKQCEESWEMIFLDSGYDWGAKLVADKPVFQAVMPRLELSWVKHSQEFTAR